MSIFSALEEAVAKVGNAIVGEDVVFSRAGVCSFTVRAVYTAAHAVITVGADGIPVHTYTSSFDVRLTDLAPYTPKADDVFTRGDGTQYTVYGVEAFHEGGCVCLCRERRPA